MSGHRIDIMSISKQVWVLYLETKECCLLWQIVYHAPVTNGQRWPSLPASDTRKQCKCFLLNCVESTEHCFWECEQARRIWDWVESVLPLASQDPLQQCNISMGQALTFEVLQFSPEIPRRWWDSFWATMLWHIWLAWI